MKKYKKRFVASLVIICLMISYAPLNVFANDITDKEIYVSKELGVTFERTIEKDKIIVNIKSSDGSLLHKLMNYDGDTYLDGEIISSNIVSEINDFEINKTYLESNLGSKDISWGPWQTNTIATIQTGGLTTVIIAGLIALYAGWCPLGVISAIASFTAGKYDELKIKVSIRYGSDDIYYYYQRYTYFYGDGELIPSPVNPSYDTGKEYL